MYGYCETCNGETHHEKIILIKKDGEEVPHYQCEECETLTKL